MRVYLQPQGLHSRAMVRVANALARHAPDGVEIAKSPQQADLVVSHVIGLEMPPETPEAVIQYCLKTTDENVDRINYERWLGRWERARLVWSYFDLPDIVGRNGFPFYHAPLGVDKAFTVPFAESLAPRDVGVMTSGYVSSLSGEAIEEVALAAWMLGMDGLHLGPTSVEGMVIDLQFRSILGCSDELLAAHYRRCRWVSGLRHIEGFEMPVIEGLCCGARPVVFDRPDMRAWYDGHAAFVPESHGQELVKHLLDVFDEDPEPVSKQEREWAATRFAWQPIAEGFWKALLS